MHEPYKAELLNVLGRCASDLQHLLLLTTGNVSVTSYDGDQQQLHAPALRYAGAKFNDIALDDIPRLMYTPNGGPLYWPLETMNEAARLMFLDAWKIHEFACGVYQNIPFSKDPGDCFVQLLIASSWSGGKLAISENSIHWKIHRQTFGLDQRSLEFRGNRNRLPLSCGGTNPKFLANQPLPSLKTLTKSMSAVYRHLIEKLPGRLHSVIDLIFSAAIFAGPEFCDKLTELFDVDFDDEIVVHFSDIWKSCRALVNESTLTPTKKLWEMLKGRVYYEDFMREFGSPYRRSRGSYYSVMLKAKQLAAITKFENGELKQTKTARKRNRKNHVAALLKLHGIEVQT